jgi:hypothetical protein
MDLLSSDGRSGWDFHSVMNIIDDRWSGRLVWSCAQIDHRGVRMIVDGRVDSFGNVFHAPKEKMGHLWMMKWTPMIYISSNLR